jgi:rhodanese-related sulfurtransferase
VPRSATREDVQRHAATGGQIVEVLPREQYDELHIKGAVNVPLRELDVRGPRELDARATVVTYCNDFL